ncbi:MAG: DUF748 domain-containing protein [Candidatus Methylomirabilales bacterium]
MRRRILTLVAAAILLVVLVIVLLPTLLSEPLRRMMERNANSRLDGYTLQIGKLRIHPLSFSLDLLDTVIVQASRPDPPMARIPLFTATVHWRALLHRRLVADILFDGPQLHITLPQAREEARDRVGVHERGWQEALLEIYPLKVNLLRIRNGEVVYVDRGPFKPLELSRVNFRADNIRNVWSPDRVYPSELHLDAVVFGQGRLTVDGAANFLAVPHPGVKGAIALDRLRLDYFRPLLEKVHLTADSGVLSAEGEVEYAPALQSVRLSRVVLERANLQYVQGATTAGREKQLRQKVTTEAKQAANEPGIRYRIDELLVRDSKLGFLNERTRPPYLVFVDDTEIRLTNLSSQGAEGPARLTLRGEFMGTGDTTVSARFRPEAKTLDLAVDLKIEGTELPAMNNLLRAHGKFDVRAGRFSLFSEVRVQDGRIRGYVKPLFQDMDVYDRGQDRHKPLLKRAYERVVGGISEILENRVRDEVATVADLSGRVENPNASALQVVVRLVQNAFFQAILPGFERAA